MHKRLPLFPLTTQIQPVDAPAQPGQQTLTIAGCSVVDLADQHATPLYLYDQATLDRSVDAYREALATHFPGPSGITYAGKAFLCTAVAQWAAHRGLWVDCTGAGELHIAQAAGVPQAQILVHGVNKTPADLRAALAQAGTLVVDNLTELHRLPALAAEMGRCPDLWLRIRPGVAVATHVHTQTGQADSKFGMDRDEAVAAVAFCLAQTLPLTGLHFHQGSHFHDPTPLPPALETILVLAAQLRDETGWTPQVLSPGGGWGVPYHEDDLPHPPVEAYVGLIAQTLEAGCEAHNLPLPRLQLEPGRSLVAQAGVAIYQVGAVKWTAGRRWLLLDGGLADNPRPALYAARYTALPIVDPLRPAEGNAWLAGPFCESGDILIHDLPMADLQPGDLVAVPMEWRLPTEHGQQLQRRPQTRGPVAARRQSPRDPAPGESGRSGASGCGVGFLRLSD